MPYTYILFSAKLINIISAPALIYKKDFMNTILGIPGSHEPGFHGK